MKIKTALKEASVVVRLLKSEATHETEKNLFIVQAGWVFVLK